MQKNMQKTCILVGLPSDPKNGEKPRENACFLHVWPQNLEKTTNMQKTCIFPRFLIDFGVPPLEFKNACVLACALARACCLD